MGLGDAIHTTSSIVTHIECAIWSYSQTYRAAKRLIILYKPASCKILCLTCDITMAVQRNKHNFVTGRYSAVPGAMKCDKEAMIALRKLLGIIESQTKWGRVGLHLHQRLHNPIAITGMPK